MKAAALFAVPILLAPLTNIANAQGTTVCSIVQVCPLKHCPYIDSDNNEYKQQVYSEGCRAYANEESYQFIKYVSGPAPQCQMIVKIDGKFDCTTLK